MGILSINSFDGMPPRISTVGYSGMSQHVDKAIEAPGLARAAMACFVMRAIAPSVDERVAAQGLTSRGSSISKPKLPEADGLGASTALTLPKGAPYQTGCNLFILGGELWGTRCARTSCTCAV